MDTKITIEKCGCEFTTYSDESGSNTFLTKCKCKKHYEEQYKAVWYDSEGRHEEALELDNPLPLED